MRFVSRNRVLVGVAIMLVLFTASVRGGEEDIGSTKQNEAPSFSVEVVVTPASGPMHIPPANPPSKPYTAFVLVRDSEVGDAWAFPRKIFYAGDTVEGKGTYGPYTITCTVTIDEHGETAKVTVASARNDGSMPGRTTYQSFTASLPRSQMLHD